jgi:hypothetical protein
VSFDARDLTVRLLPGADAPGLFACNVCDSTPGAPKPNCPAPSKPQCQAPSVKPPKKRSVDLEALNLAALRSQLRETLHQVR